ncbi:MAG: zf-TFIIB domain-containing protein [bacterium]|nr:zf-TFIIB domain-containing protein [bacterium]
MNCPVCKESELVISERQGIEIDYCPKCRGVWLDRGELDKIIERSVKFDEPDQKFFDNDRKYDDRKKYSDDYYKRNKRKSFLGEIFDF